MLASRGLSGRSPQWALVTAVTKASLLIIPITITSWLRKHLPSSPTSQGSVGSGRVSPRPRCTDERSVRLTHRAACGRSHCTVTAPQTRALRGAGMLLSPRRRPRAGAADIRGRSEELWQVGAARPRAPSAPGSCLQKAERETRLLSERSSVAISLSESETEKKQK